MKIFTWSSREKSSHKNFTWRFSREFHVNFTWISRESSFHVNFTWKFSCEFHVKALFTWISRDSFQRLFLWKLCISFKWNSCESFFNLYIKQYVKCFDCSFYHICACTFLHKTTGSHSCTWFFSRKYVLSSCIQQVHQLMYSIQSKNSNHCIFFYHHVNIQTWCI